jgi:hypothetical protein
VEDSIPWGASGIVPHVEKAKIKAKTLKSDMLFLQKRWNPVTDSVA